MDVRTGHEALHLDQDIQGVTGSPDLARTIFNKVEAAEVVVADVTIVGATGAQKKLINSNVAIELGYALHARTDQNVLLVLNQHYGMHEDRLSISCPQPWRQCE